MNGYGQEVIIDMYGCDPSTFTRKTIELFFNDLGSRIGVQCEDLHFWDDVGVPKNEQQTDPRLVGTSAVQFILTSTMILHTLDLRSEVYFNLFSCDAFDEGEVIRICRKWFGGRVLKSTNLTRGET